MVQAIAAATQQIHVLNLEFDPAFIATFTRSEGQLNACTSQTILINALLAANAKGVKVRILVNKNVWADSTGKLATFLGSAAAGQNTIEVQGVHLLPEVVHAKTLIIDSAVAFSVGLPLDQGYWDTQLHPIVDPCSPSRRGSGAGGNIPGFGEVGNGVGNKPAHTVSLQVNGPSAADADNAFIALWNSVSTDTVPMAMATSAAGSQTVQWVRSAPPLPAAGLPQGEKGVLEAHLRAIANASSFIYFEEQYFTSPVIGDALVKALSGNPGLQLILLLNENPDMPTYKFWQNSLLGRLATLPKGQVGVFSLWRTGAGPSVPSEVAPGLSGPATVEIMQCYMEAKVGIVDDAWAIVGSGNLDGASLGHMFEFLPSPLLCMSGSKGWRNVELSAVLYDGIAGQPSTGQVASLRRALWQEHLGTGLDLTTPPSGGWLSLWNSVANGNVASLNATQTMADGPSMILPYASALLSSDQLAQLGIDVSMLDVAPVVPS